MNNELSDIYIGLKRSIGLIPTSQRLSLLLAILLMAVTGLLTNLPAIIIGRLVDQMTSIQTFSFFSAVPFIILVFLILIFREMFTVIRKLIVENIVTQTEKTQSVAVISNLLKSDLTFLNAQQVGSLHGRVIRSVQGLVSMIKLAFLEFLPVLFSAVAAIGLALFQKPLLASVMILVIPTSLYIIFKQISSQKGIRVALLRGKEKIDGTVVEMLGGIESIRVANTTDHELSKIQSIAENLRLREIKHHLSMALFDAAKQLNEGIFYIIVISLSIYFSTIGLISQGDILVYSILFVSITGPLREVHRIMDQSHESSIRVNDLFDLLGQPQDKSFGSSSSEPVNYSNVLEIKNLSFSYPGKSLQIIRDLSLTIKKGEKIGIVSASGGGKSTLIKIILRLIHDYQGSINFFGQNLENLTRKELAEKIAYVPQRTYIFSGTIQDNITYGAINKPSLAEIVSACKKASIYDEINSSLGGLNGKVTENGNNLSGGQKQRIALARLILKAPELIILDEATSALDNTNEEIIQENIDQLFKDKTTITIAHRLTTLKNSDRIIVLDKGKISQEGDFSKLSQETGMFKEFLLGKV